MKHLFTALAALVLIPAATLAQITVQQSQIKSAFVIGDSLSMLVFSDTTINIGKKGGPNFYDFSSVNFFQAKGFIELGSSSQITSRDFANDTVISTPGGYQVVSFTPSEMIGTGKVNLKSDTSYDVVVRVPGEVIMNFPLTYTKTWSYSFENFDTTFVKGVGQQPGSNAANRTCTVDGYGTLILPGGDSLQCLRVLQTDTNPADSSEETLFFVTGSGLFLAVDSYFNQPDTGIIKVNDAQVFGANLNMTGVRQVSPEITTFLLDQNYPNPFNPTTVISYQLTVSSSVTLKVFDVLGREVATLVNAREDAGAHQVIFDSKGLPSGVYFYRLAAGSRVETKKLVIMK